MKNDKWGIDSQINQKRCLCCGKELWQMGRGIGYYCFNCKTVWKIVNYDGCNHITRMNDETI